ncbi:MAG TPA: VWA domain-containing protein [Bryobacteraceae bacterium]
MRKTLAIFSMWLLAVSAQQGVPQGGSNTIGVPRGTVTFSTTRQLVVEDVIVKSQNGSPVDNLKASDFLVTEDGKPQQISVFEFQKLSNEAVPAPSPALQQRTQVAAAAPAPAVKPLTAVEIAPEKPGDLKYRDKRLMVMFFDMTSMPIQDQMRAQASALKFLNTQMTASDLMAIMTFASDIKVVEDFTDDRDLLAQDIKKLVIGEGLGLDETVSDDSASDTGAAFQQDDTEFNIFNTDRQLSALETAVKMLASLNEKKALVYFASGMTRNGLDNQAQLQATINAAIRSNVSFYPIDARGLVAAAPLGDATKGSPGSQGMYSGSSARAVTSNFQGQQETLYTLASDTGGKALLDNNDLSMGIVQAQKDISSYYIIGYYSANEALDGRFRRVKIALKDKDTAARVARLDYRQGYYASKEFGKLNTTDKERQLAEALMLGDPVTDIDIAVEIDYFRLAHDRYFVPVVAKIPGSELELARHGGAESTRIDFIGQVKDSAGKIVQNVRDMAEVKLKGQTAADLAKHPLEYDTGFTLAPGKYNLKFLARENETGKMGTYEINFVIPDLTADQKLLPISSVILSSQRIALDAAVFSAERDKKLLEANPLVAGGQKLVPSVTRVFNKNQEMYIYLEAYEPAATATQPIIASVAFYRGKTKAFESAPLEVSQGLNDKSKALPVRFSLPLSKLQPGRYTCQVSVLNPTAQKFAFWRAPMVLMQ